jgi:two-component system chemotaxis response regulator CheY
MTRFLIVDDAQFMRHSLRKVLEKNGFLVVGEAEDGYMAVKKFKELRPDIITMDITMPEKNGIEALKEIKEIDKDCIIVMFSSMAQESFVRKAILSGADDYILKPFKEEDIIDKLTKLLSKKNNTKQKFAF